MLPGKRNPEDSNMNMMNPLQQAFDQKKIDDQAFHSICWFFPQFFIAKFKGSWILKH
jgi:hypothetical protein